MNIMKVLASIFFDFIEKLAMSKSSLKTIFLDRNSEGMTMNPLAPWKSHFIFHKCQIEGNSEPFYYGTHGSRLGKQEHLSCILDKLRSQRQSLLQSYHTFLLLSRSLLAIFTRPYKKYAFIILFSRSKVGKAGSGILSRCAFEKSRLRKGLRIIWYVLKRTLMSKLANGRCNFNLHEF